jgi:hypothetical protein
MVVCQYKRPCTAAATANAVILGLCHTSAAEKKRKSTEFRALGISAIYEFFLI